jgi:hypothetical protein
MIINWRITMSEVDNEYPVKGANTGDNSIVREAGLRHTIAQQAEQIKVLKNLLDRSVTGLQWWIAGHPSGASYADDEHLDECKAALLPPQQKESTDV